jgi:predicted nucleotidyltransferase
MARSAWVPPSRTTECAAPAAATAEEALEFAGALARSCSQALGQTVAGVVLHGSLTLDDYVPGRSDVDLLVVVDEPLTDAQVAALTEAMASHRAKAPGPVDLRLVTRQVAASPTPAPLMEAYLRLAPGSGVRLEERRHPGERDLVVELSVCRAHGRSLLGAAPAELTGEVPDRWVVAAGDAQLADWQAIGDDPPYAELTVLTACRVWRFAEEGRHCSKAAAAQWALRRDPTLGVVHDALRQRHRDPAHRIDAAQVARLLAVVRACLARHATPPRPCLKVSFPTAWPMACPAARTGAALNHFARARLVRYDRGIVSLLGAHEIRVWPPRQFPG